MSEAILKNTIVQPTAAETEEIQSTKALGFWIYLMSDCVLFSVLFATFAVFSSSYAGGPSGKELFSLPFVLMETFFLLISSFTCGLAILAVNASKKIPAITWLIITAIFGLAFVSSEIHEFTALITEGHGPDQSAFLSAFFTLVGTHGLHVSCGLLWLATMVGQVMKKGITPNTSIRLVLFSLFWHFLDIIWVCIFTLIYLLGVLR